MVTALVHGSAAGCVSWPGLRGLRPMMALTMNIGPLVLTNSGPPPGVFDLLSRA
jgi:hypothetical protein